MSSHAAQTTQAAAQLFTGATLGSGIMSWMSMNSGAVTAITVMITGIASLYYGYENKKSVRMNAIANQNRNKINDRDITQDIIDKLWESGKDEKYIDDFIDSIQK